MFAPILLSINGCGSDTTSTIETPLSEVDLGVQQAINYSTVPAVNEFSQSTVLLNQEVDDFCLNKSTDNLLSLQTAWQSSYVSWYKVLPFQFGPLTLSNNSSKTLDYIDSYRNATPANRVSNLAAINPHIKSLIESASTISETSFANARPQEVGLYPLQSAIFSTTNDQTLNADIVSEFTSNAKKCHVIQALAYELNRQATLIQSQWIEDYRDTQKSYEFLFGNNELENYFSVIDIEGDGTGKPASEALVVALQEFLDFTGNTPLFTDLTQYSSDTIWQALSASVTAIENTLMASDSPLTLVAIIKNNGFEQDAISIQENIAYIKEAISDKNPTNFYAASKALDGNFKTTVLDGLNINKGLTFADGDS